MEHIGKIILAALGIVSWGQTGIAQNRSPFVPGGTDSARGHGVSDQGRVASLQSTCKDAKGTLVEFFSGGADSPGTLSNAGWLNGKTLAVFNSAGFPTPVPTQYSFTAAYTVTTGQGQLKGTRTFIYDVAAGWGMDMTMIDPVASSGIFAGATGVLYTNQIVSNTASPPTTYVSEISGRICFVK